MRRYQDLEVWRLAHELTLSIYKQTKDFPPDERFGLTSQLRRACVSIEANLAEGSKKSTDVDYARFINIAEGSVAEVEVLVKIAADVGFLSTKAFDVTTTQVTQVSKMLYSLRKTIAS